MVHLVGWLRPHLVEDWVVQICVTSRLRRGKHAVRLSEETQVFIAKIGNSFWSTCNFLETVPTCTLLKSQVFLLQHVYIVYITFWYVVTSCQKLGMAKLCELQQIKNKYIYAIIVYAWIFQICKQSAFLVSCCKALWIFCSDRHPLDTSSHRSLAKDHLFRPPDFDHWHAPNGATFNLLVRCPGTGDCKDQWWSDQWVSYFTYL